jgi:Magnesium chelatase, subunit ChlI
LVTTLPCRAPYHTILDAGLIGRGHVPMPGEVSLPQHGVLCWGDECRRNIPSSCLLYQETKASNKPAVVRTYGGLRVSARCSSRTSIQLPGAATLRPKVKVKTALIAHKLGLPLTVRVITWPILILRTLASDCFPPPGEAAVQRDGRGYVLLLSLNEEGSHQPPMVLAFREPVASLPTSVQAARQFTGDSRSPNKKPLSNSRRGTKIAWKEP